MSYTHDFIKKVKPYALNNSVKKKILPSIIIAQAILESDWGRSGLSTRCNNYFGIKGNQYNGILFSTKEEYVKGKITTIKSYFKKYDNIEESFADHSNLFYRVKVGNKLRYQRVLDSRNYLECADALQNCGYATDKHYSDKLISIIRNYKLMEIDSEYFKLIKPKNVSHETSKNVSHETISYKVKSGDTLSEICGTNDRKILQEVAMLNKLKSIHLIRIGQVLKIPKKLVK